MFAEEQEADSSAPSPEAIKEKRKTYWHEYWSKNKDRILANRAVRYAEDPDYRKGIIDRSKERFRAGKIGRHRPNPEKQVKARSRVMKSGAGQTFIIYGTSETGSRLGYSSQSIRKWVQDRICPKPTAIDKAGRLWFSDDWIKFMDEMLEKFRIEAWDLDHFKKRVQEAWKERGKE
jgi:hypothetical protein